jgi:hypothetical protein
VWEAEWSGSQAPARSAARVQEAEQGAHGARSACVDEEPAARQARSDAEHVRRLRVECVAARAKRLARGAGGSSAAGVGGADPVAQVSFPGARAFFPVACWTRAGSVDLAVRGPLGGSARC